MEGKSTYFISLSRKCNRKIDRRWKNMAILLTNWIACSRRSDSGAQAKTKASERAGKKEGRLGERTFFSRSFARFIFRSRSTIWTPGTGYQLNETVAVNFDFPARGRKRLFLDRMWRQFSVDHPTTKKVPGAVKCSPPAPDISS